MIAGGFDLLDDPGCANFALKIIDDDFGTVLGEARSYRGSDPPRAARHQRDPFLPIACQLPLPPWRRRA
jgi:hypothetical protein